MFATFKKKVGPVRSTFHVGKQISLFECQEGWIPWLLKEMMRRDQGEPYPWHVRIADGLALPALKKEFPDAGAIIIDIGPMAKDEFFICELLDVYGYSASSWTPMLWCMKVLEISDRSKGDHLEDFLASNHGDIIYEFLYAMGSVQNSQITRTWNPPKPGPTNGVLLWPDALTYFLECIKAGRGGAQG